MWHPLVFLLSITRLSSNVRSATRLTVPVNMFFLLFFFSTLLLVVMVATKAKNKRVGKIFTEPWGLPLLGHLFFLGKNPAITFAKWKQSLGPVFWLNFAGKRVLVLNDRGSIKEAFGKPEFAGRRAFKLWDFAIEESGGGIIMDEGPKVEDLRQFFLKAFRQHGIQRNKMEEHFQAEIHIFLEQWQSKQGEFFPLRSAFGHLVLNCVWRVLGSTRYEFQEAEALLHEIGRFLNMDKPVTKLATFAPGFVKIFSRIVDDKLDACRILTASMKASVTEHNHGRIIEEPRDIIDKFLDTFEVLSQTAPSDSPYHNSNHFIESALRDVLCGTIETTSNSLQWFVLQGICQPRVVQKLQLEIDTVVGKDRTPTLQDKPNMPYTEACILENLRFSSGVLGLPHVALEDAQFRGESIPKGTILVGNIYAVHYNPKEWDEPNTFKPERFLAPDGRTLIPDAFNKILSFSVGKRSCIGSGIVIDELFLIITSIYQRFSLTAGEQQVTTEGIFGFTYRPRSGQSNIAAIPR